MQSLHDQLQYLTDCRTHAHTTGDTRGTAVLDEQIAHVLTQLTALRGPHQVAARPPGHP